MQLTHKHQFQSNTNALAVPSMACPILCTFMDCSQILSKHLHCLLKLVHDSTHLSMPINCHWTLALDLCSNHLCFISWMQELRNLQQSRTTAATTAQSRAVKHVSKPSCQPPVHSIQPLQTAATQLHKDTNDYKYTAAATLSLARRQYHPCHPHSNSNHTSRTSNQRPYSQTHG